MTSKRNQHNTAVFAVPRHQLSDEQRELFLREMAASQAVSLRQGTPTSTGGMLDVAVWRGRGAVDPLTPDKNMCWRLDEVEKLEENLIPADTLCKRKQKGQPWIFCPYYDQCGYQRQQTQRPHVWYAAHEMLTKQKPAAFGEIITIAVDEDPLDAFLFGVDKPFEMALNILMEPPQRAPKYEQGKLMRGRKALYDALKDLPDGPVPRTALKTFDEHFLAAWDSEEEWGIKAREMYALEWTEKIEPVITPTMGRDQVFERAKIAQENRHVNQRATLWRIVQQAAQHNAPDLCGRLEMRTVANGTRVVAMCGIAQMTTGWADASLLVSDATGQPELLKHIWPDLQISPKFIAQMPHTKIFQQLDCEMGKSTYVPDKYCDEQEKERRLENCRLIYTRVVREALRYGGQQVLLITYMGLEHEIRSKCVIPPWLHIEHHGNITGLDRYKNVRAIYILGRPLPPANTVCRIARALTGDWIDGRYEIRQGYIRPIDPEDPESNRPDENNTCRVWGVDQWRHPHPVADMVRAAACEGGLVQAAGRGRGADRTAENPLDIWVLADTPVPEFNTHGIIGFLADDQIFSIDDEMLAYGGVYLENQTHAVKAYPDLLKSRQNLIWNREEAIYEGEDRQGRPLYDGGWWRSHAVSEYAKLSVSPKGSTYRGNLHFSGTEYRPGSALVRVRYRLAEQRSPWASAVFLAGTEPGLDPKGWLEKKLGPVAECIRG
jgi:hypothetical protein